MTAIAPPPALAATVLELVDRARTCLLAACRADDVDDRYRQAQLAALRATAAVLAVRDPKPKRGRPRNAWVALRAATPELGEWADFFERSGARVQALDRGSIHVTLREADDHVREAETYLGIVLGELGLPLAADVTAGLARTRRVAAP